MGSVKAKPVRQTPVRYVAKQLPRNNTVPIEQQFKKPVFSAQGINSRRDDVNTEPLMYVETSKEAGATEVTDHVAPRWYLNTFMEMTDNRREDQCVISGNMPMSWFRDKYEPYSLVRGRIDDEDLRWVLAPEQRKKNVSELAQFTKLERSVLQDILDTVELPRRQYRNYKGKLHKAVDDVNTHMSARKVQLERAREAELLREIGFTEEEVAKDQQYLTNRPRGLKTLDDLGASTREREHLDRASKANDLELLLHERHIHEIEQGNAAIDEAQAIQHNENEGIFTERFFPRVKAYKAMYRADIGRDKTNHSKLQWWLERSRRITRAVDVVHSVPIYNERLTATEEELHSQMNEAAKFNFEINRAQGAKGFADPRDNFDNLLEALRTDKLASSNDDQNTYVQEDEVTNHDIYRFPHSKHHASKPQQPPLTNRRDRLEAVDIDEDREMFGEFVPKATTSASDLLRRQSQSQSHSSPSTSSAKTVENNTNSCDKIDNNNDETNSELELEEGLE